MSGIQNHTQDPISPANTEGVTPKTAYKPKGTSQPAETTVTEAHNYPLAQPGAAAPTPTRTSALSFTHGPPPPQPGAVATSAPPLPTAKTSLPPPPKAGEKPMPPEHYAPAQAVPTHSQPYPPQMAHPPLGPSPSGMLPRSTTSTTTQPSFTPSAPSAELSASTESPSRLSLEHPPGYVQNQYASDMTPAQRLAAVRQEKQSDTVPSLGYTNSNASGSAGYGEREGVWDMATRWAKKKGEQASELHGQVWERIDDFSKGK